MDLSERANDSFVRHPWEVARFHFFQDLIDDLGALDTQTRIIDVGAGDAWFAMQLQRHLGPSSHVTCWDVNYTIEDLRDLNAASSGLAMDFTVERPSESSDIVLALDVIEHVEDDEDFTRSLVGLVRPGGLLVVSVPAYQSLFSSHDVTLAHFRRYGPSEVRSLLQRCGLSVELEGGLFHLLLPLRALQVALERVLGREGRGAGIGTWRAGPRITRGLVQVLGAEARLSRRWASRGHVVPGLSYWAVARPATT